MAHSKPKLDFDVIMAKTPCYIGLATGSTAILAGLAIIGLGVVTSLPFIVGLLAGAVFGLSGVAITGTSRSALKAMQAPQESTI